jgi:8-oxo-dGTP pyrophosphatase MutT (NUDIX family)
LKPFLEEAQGELQRRRIFSLRQDTVRSAQTGQPLHVDRLFCPDWVNVVAFTADDALIVVRQWRFGTKAFSVEVPAGALHPGEDPVVGGLRELVEETGYTPDDAAAVVHLGATRPNPAFMDNRCHTIFVPRATRTRPQQLDESEEVEVATIPRARLDGLMREAARAAAGLGQVTGDDGERVLDHVLDNALVVVALQLWRLHVDATAPAGR